MSKEKIIAKIIANKKQPNLRFRLKRKVEAFTDLLFLTLFDIETPVPENIDTLALQFDELVD
ncbi:MAG: serine acetyltransferase, partial [Flavobacteriaceae bacterium]|nr:serine acetyltransferase [Eudoraea sp.]NNJ38903.1 serine acetyltransferase [Flavobacteriaceae bacterium]